jgi:hypothetical protein
MLALCAAPVLAQTSASSSDQHPIEPDRPDVTNGAHLVDPGLLQLEMGGVFTRTSSTAHDVGTPITARVGVTDWFEFRLSGDGYRSSTEAGATERGLGNVQLAAKVRVLADSKGGGVFSILPSVNLPVASASKGLGSGHADYTVALLTGTDFWSHEHVDVNYGIGSIGAGAGARRFSQHLLSVSANTEVGLAAPYLEVYGLSRQDPDGGPFIALDTGAIFTLTPRVAVDGGVQVGLSDAARGVSVFGGLSIAVTPLSSRPTRSARGQVSRSPQGSGLRIR